MNWESILNEIIAGIVGLIISVVGTYMTYFISTKIKDEKLRKIATSLNDIVRKAVLVVYQTYVEELKDNDEFGQEEQSKALFKALDMVNQEITPEVRNWLSETQADVNKYIMSLIEAQIALAKK